MKYLLIGLAIAVSVLIGLRLLGFLVFGIPLGEEIYSEKILGTKVNTATGVDERILQRVTKSNYYNLIHPDGSGKKYSLDTKYIFASKGSNIELAHLEKAMVEEKGGLRLCCDIEEPILPVGETDKWIATQLYYMEADHVGINFIVFDKKEIQKKIQVPNCLRGGRFWNSYGLEYKDVNTKVIFHTVDGDYRMDVLTGAMNKIK